MGNENCDSRLLSPLETALLHSPPPLSLSLSCSWHMIHEFRASRCDCVLQRMNKQICSIIKFYTNPSAVSADRQSKIQREWERESECEKERANGRTRQISASWTEEKVDLCLEDRDGTRWFIAEICKFIMYPFFAFSSIWCKTWTNVERLWDGKQTDGN